MASSLYWLWITEDIYNYCEWGWERAIIWVLVIDNTVIYIIAGRYSPNWRRSGATRPRKIDWHVAAIQPKYSRGSQPVGSGHLGIGPIETIGARDHFAHSQPHGVRVILHFFLEICKFFTFPVMRVFYLGGRGVAIRWLSSGICRFATAAFSIAIYQNHALCRIIYEGSDPRLSFVYITFWYASMRKWSHQGGYDVSSIAIPPATCIDPCASMNEYLALNIYPHI